MVCPQTRKRTNKGKSTSYPSLAYSRFFKTAKMPIFTDIPASTLPKAVAVRVGEPSGQPEVLITTRLA
jgi:hypothetical protein